MIKRIFTFLFILTLSINLSAQNKKIINIHFGYGQNNLNHLVSLVCATSYRGDGTFGFGVGYQQYLNKNLSVLSGIDYSFNKVIRNSSYYSPTEKPSNIKIISIPLKIEYQFLSYLIIGGGAILDFEIDRKIDSKTDQQFGIGAGIHTGIKASFNSISIGIIPYFNIHTLIPFQMEKYHQRLFEAGVKLMVGYQI